MALSTTSTFLDDLRRYWLLEPEQLAELDRLEPARFADPKALAQELLQRGWLTAYQANQLLQGKAAELVLGSYVLLDKLGQGGMGAVFKARHQVLGRVVALKLIRKDCLANATAAKRFRREIQAAAQLNHPNIVLAFDADQVAGNHFFTMEYVPGTDLAKLVKEKGPLPVDRACEYIRQAALGLQHAYAQGMIHRDIKPHNLLLTANGETVKILDMGLARFSRTESEESEATALTQTGAIMGTPDYIAPEQARETREVDIRADLYSLGCTFYQLLTGQVPFPVGSMTAKLLQHQMDQPKPVEELRPEVPPAVGAVVRKLMAKQPEDRYQTPAELAQVLADLASGRSPPADVAQPVAAPLTAVQAVTSSRQQERQARERRQKRLLWVGTGLLVPLLAVLAFLMLQSTRKNPQDHAVLPAGPPPVTIPPQAQTVPPLRLAFALGNQQGLAWGRITALAFSPDGKTLVSGDDGPAARFWDMATLQEKTQADANAETLAFAPDGRTMATGADNSALKVWSLTGPVPKLLSQMREYNPVLGFSADGRLLATIDVSNKRTVLWDVSGAILQEAAALAGQVYRGAVSRDGKTLVTVTAEDQQAHIWDLSDPRLPRQRGVIPLKHYKPFLALTANGERLALTEDNANNVMLWDLSGPEPRMLGNKPLKGLDGLTLSPDGTILACRNRKATALYDVKEGKLEARGQPISATGPMAFSADSKTLALGIDRAVTLWDVSGPEPKARFPLPDRTDGVRVLELSRDGQTLASLIGNVVILWDVAERQERLRLDTTASSMAYHPAGRLLATTTKGIAKLWDPATGKAVRDLPFQGTATFSVFSPDGALLAISGSEGRVKLLDVDTGQERHSLTSSGHLAFSPDGRLLATTTKVFEVATGQERFAIDGIGRVAFRPDSKVVANSGGGGSTAQGRLFDTTTGQLLRKLATRGSCVAFSPDGRLLARSSYNGEPVLVLDAETGETRQEISLPGPTPVVTFSPNGEYLITGNGNGSIYFYRLPPSLVPTK